MPGPPPAEGPARTPGAPPSAAALPAPALAAELRPLADPIAEHGIEALRELFHALPEELASQAFRHSSWTEHRLESWERLAFLGDVVLSLAVSTHLFPRFPRFGAGRLTKLRAQAVSRTACAQVARRLGIPEHLEAAAPAESGREAEALTASERILASVCEAVIGAVYLSFGFERVAPAVVAAFSEEIAIALRSPVDFKSVLQERLARRSAVVAYRTASEAGPPHDRRFVAVAVVSGEEIGRGEGKTKKSAEQEAALRALDHLGEDLS